MTSLVFDTLKAANSLKAAGFDDRQAEAVVTKDHLEPMAAKSDLQLTQHQVTTRPGALIVAVVGVLGVLIGPF